MNVEKQKLIINYLISNPDLFAKCQAIVKPEYFDPTVRNILSYSKKYFEQFKALPNNDQIKAETGLTTAFKELTTAEVAYTETEIETFCRQKAIETAILSSPALLEKGDYSTIEKSIREAISVGLQRELGTDFFLDAQDWFAKLTSNEMMIPTGWIELDNLLNGGINRQEMIIFAAVSGGGKSITVANLAVNFLRRKQNVLYITLELAEAVVAKRIASMVTGVSQSDMLHINSNTVVKIQNAGNDLGQLFIKRFPESVTNVNHIRAYMKEFELVNGFIPDLIVIDYLDIMAPVNNTFTADNIFGKEKAIAEELRALGHQFNCCICTCSQINRSGMDDLHSLAMDNIAGSIGKVMTADNLIAIIQTDAMRNKGEYMFKLLKTRSSGGVGKVILLKWDPISLRITNIETGKGGFSRPINNSPAETKAASKPEGKKIDLLSIINN